MKGILIENGKLVNTVKRDGNSLITSGIALGDTLVQDQELLLISEPGDFKEFPILGIGITNYLNDDENRVTDLHASIESQYRMAGFKIVELLGTKASETTIKAVRDE